MATEFDLLQGYQAIAEFTGLPLRRIEQLIEQKVIPTFKLGHYRCARKSSLIDWLAKLEQGAFSLEPR
jgi:hypothetical protein